jgi:hypothetical protein
VAVVYNVVLFQSVGTLSSVGTAILGNVKIVRAGPAWPGNLLAQAATASAVRP